MPLSHVLTNLDDARDTLVNSINSRGGNLEESATLYQCAAAVNALASGVLSINGHLPDESGSVTIPDATQSASGLMSAEDKVKLDGITSGITSPETIPNNGDLNNLHSAGVYRMGSVSGAQSLSNCPVETAFSLIVLNPTLSGCVQMLYEYGTGATFTRALKDSGQWSDWSKTLNSESISENFGSSGYFKLPGGTIVQYGQVGTSSSSNSVLVTLPIAYTATVYTILANCGTNNTPVAVTRSGSLTTIRLYTPSPIDGATIFWMTVGY